MAVGSVSPVGIQQFFDANGDPLAGGKLYFYLAGTTTPTPAYADVGLLTPLANPVILDAAGRAPELFLGALTYKQVLKTAGDVTIWTADNIVTPTALRSTGGTISLTGNQNNVPIPAGVITFLNCDNSLPLTITGFAGGTPGQILIVRSGDVAPVFLVHGDTVNSPGNSLDNFVTSGPTPLASASGMAMYVYQLGIWILVAHEQGAWIDIPIVPAKFSAFGGAGGTWVPSTGSFYPGTPDTSFKYRVSGTTVLLTGTVTFSTVTGAPTTLALSDLQYAIRTSVLVPITISPSGLPAESGFIRGISPDRTIYLNRKDAALAWPAGGTHLWFQVTFDVQ